MPKRKKQAPASGKLFAEPQGDFFEKSAEEAAETSAEREVEWT